MWFCVSTDFQYFHWNQNSPHVTRAYSLLFPWLQTTFCMQAGLFKRLDNCVSSLNLFCGSGWDVWFFGNQLIHKIISGSYPLALKSVCLRSYYFIHQTKPDHVGYQEAKGFYDPSTFSWEKGYITFLGNFWTPCRKVLAHLTWKLLPLFTRINLTKNVTALTNCQKGTPLNLGPLSWGQTCLTGQDAVPVRLNPVGQDDVNNSLACVA